jgi:hypothetical protein
MRAVFYLIAISLLLSIEASPQSVDVNPPTERSIFGLEGSFDAPVDLPAGVVKALMATKAARQTRAFMQLNHDSDASQYFLGKEVHLIASDEADYVVLGKVPGADCLQFWLVRQSAPRSQVVLYASGTTLEVLPSEHGGLQDIRIDWWAGNGYGWADVYRFNGSRYVRFQRLDTYWEFRPESGTSSSSWILTKSSPSLPAPIH